MDFLIPFQNETSNVNLRQLVNVKHERRIDDHWWLSFKAELSVIYQCAMDLKKGFTRTGRNDNVHVYDISAYYIHSSCSCFPINESGVKHCDWHLFSGRF